jgi:hypothetical protein
VFGRGPRDVHRLLIEGREGMGHIVGIRVFEVAGDETPTSRVDEYALEVPAVGPHLLGIRQALFPPGLVRLGMEVAVRHDDERAAIDWERTCGGTVGTSRFIRRVPERGIVDESLALARARERHRAASLSIIDARVVPALLGMVQALVLDVEVRVEGADPYPAQIPIGAGPPHYATHLCEPGTVLPAWVNPKRPDRPIADWPAAATADPGVGRPPAAVLARLGSVTGDAPP